jgi:hypothetical protein
VSCLGPHSHASAPTCSLSCTQADPSAKPTACFILTGTNRPDRVAQPPEPEPELQGVRPNEEHVKMLGAMGFDEATARQCLSVAFNDLELAAQYCMEGIPANRVRRA